MAKDTLESFEEGGNVISMRLDIQKSKAPLELLDKWQLEMILNETCCGKYQPRKNHGPREKREDTHMERYNWKI